MKEYIAGFDFWGHCDCDLIFWDIRSLLPEHILNRYDRLFTCGHFYFYRNDYSVNNLYRIFDNECFRLVQTSSDSFAFDEWKGNSEYWNQSSREYYNELPYDDIILGLDGFYITKKTGKDSSYPRLDRDKSA